MTEKDKSKQTKHKTTSDKASLAAKPESKLEFHGDQEVISVEKNVVSFSAETKSGRIYYSRAMVLAYGGNLEFGLENLTDKELNGRIKVDYEQKTSLPGLFAAGFCAAGIFKDVFISSGEGAKAGAAAAELLGKI